MRSPGCRTRFSFDPASLRIRYLSTQPTALTSTTANTTLHLPSRPSLRADVLSLLLLGLISLPAAQARDATPPSATPVVVVPAPPLGAPIATQSTGPQAAPQTATTAPNSPAALAAATNTTGSTPSRASAPAPGSATDATLASATGGGETEQEAPYSPAADPPRATPGSDQANTSAPAEQPTAPHAA